MSDKREQLRDRIEAAEARQKAREIGQRAAGAADRVTETLFDWRNRAVAVKSGVEASESTGVNRPLVVTTYDNLNQVTQTQVYDGDAITPSISSGVLSLPGGTSSN